MKLRDEEDRYHSNTDNIGYLRDFAIDLGNDIGIGAVDQHGNLIIPDVKVFGEYTDLLAQCHVELGDWQASMRMPGEPVGPVYRCRSR
jgi:FKBP12-rapamycin complex-associated protein